MYEFTFGSFFLGAFIVVAGAAIVVFHQKLADNLGSGISSYDRFRFWGLIICGIGIIVMLSLHTIVLNWLVDSIFGR